MTESRIVLYAWWIPPEVEDLEAPEEAPDCSSPGPPDPEAAPDCNGRQGLIAA